MDTAWIGFLNRFLIIGIIVSGIIIINYPPTKLAINIPHKRSLSAIGIAYIVYQFLIALNIGGAINSDRATILAITRILELGVYIALAVWAGTIIKEKITVR